MKLNSLAIQNAKPRDRPYRLPDGDGLALQIETSGAKLWRFRFRFGGKANMLSFGAYPEVSLAAAREKREEARRLLADGKNPSEQKKLDRMTQATAAQNTFGVLATEYVEQLKENQRAVTTLEKNTWLLLDLAKPLHDRPIRDVTAAEILDIIKKVEKSGRRETARRLRSAIGSVFRFAISTLRAENDPTFALRGSLLQPIVTHRPAITDEKKLGALMLSIDEYDGWPTIKAALQFLALTMTRPGDVRFMKRPEVNFIKKLWSIPAERMKMRRPHDVPLSTQALDALRSIWELSEGDSFVFPAIRAARPLSEATLNVALRRMGYSKDEHCAHGFRASASTILNERGHNPEVIEAALAHQDEDKVRRAYNRALYFEERTKLLQDWADLLDSFRNQAVTRTA